MSAIAASGYTSPISSLFTPNQISDKIVSAYYSGALTPQLAKSNFFSDEELFCGASVTFGRETPLDLFTQAVDNNEHPELIENVGMETDTLTICQHRKFEVKISNLDKRQMCQHFAMWEASLRKRLDRGIIRLIDAYTVPKILASASPHNVGKNAGKITAMHNLGTQDDNALQIRSAEEFEDLVFTLREVAQEAGMTLGSGETPYEGEGANPVLLIPSHMERYAMKLMRDLNTCCSDNNIRVNGKLGTVYGYDVLTTSLLTPVDFGGGVGKLNHIALIDRNQVLHAMDIITNKWWEGKYEEALVGEFIFDTHVMNPDGVIVATVKV